MVKKFFIEKTFDDVIGKHSDFLYNIEGTLREITDSKEEYKTLKEDIWRFWKETKNSDHEQMIVKGTDGSFFENRDGKSHSVAIPETAKKFVSDGGQLMYLIHNHPFPKGEDSSCFQSSQDINLMAFYKVKYMASIGEDGIMVVKNPTSKYLVGGQNLFSFEVSQRYDKVFKEIVNGFHKDYEDKINSLKQEYDVDNKLYDELEEYRMESNELLNDYISEHIGGFVDNLSNEFQSVKKDSIGTVFDAMDSDCYYVPRSPRI